MRTETEELLERIEQWLALADKSSDKETVSIMEDVFFEIRILQNTQKVLELRLKQIRAKL